MEKRKRMSDAELKNAIKKAVEEKMHFRSIAELKRSLSGFVEEEHGSLGITTRRILKILKGMKNVRVIIHPKKRKGKPVTVCPLCGSRLKEENVLSLSGEKIFVGMKCPTCGFRSESRSFTAGRYEIFLQSRGRSAR